MVACQDVLKQSVQTTYLKDVKMKLKYAKSVLSNDYVLYL